VRGTKTPDESELASPGRVGGVDVRATRYLGPIMSRVLIDILASSAATDHVHIDMCAHLKSERHGDPRHVRAPPAEQVKPVTGGRLDQAVRVEVHRIAESGWVGEMAKENSLVM